jgi:hypothetical protein
MVGGVISLALVAGGYAWQMLRSPAAVAGPTAAPNAGTKHLSSAEREERSKALIEARDIALKTRDFWDAHRQIQMNETLVPMIKDGKTSIALEKMADDFKPIENDAQQFARKYSDWLPEIYNALLGQPHTQYLLALGYTYRNFGQEISNWINKAEGLDHIQRSAAYSEWQHAMNGTQSWVNQTPSRLAQLRREYDNQ